MARRPVPADLEDALAANPAARERFWSLPPEQLDGWVAWVERSRFPGQRRRRVAETVRRLGGGRVAVAETREGAAVVPLPRDDWWVWLLGLALLAALAAFLVWLTVFRHHGRQSSPAAVVVTAKATVPKVTGIKLQAAEFQLRQAKLATKLVRRNASKPRDIVLAQAPQAAKRVVEGTVVTLVVSRGPAGVRLPKLEGLAAADAVRKLQALGLTATLRQVAAQGAPGTVVSQSPQPGTRAKRGTAVVLQVVKGRAKQATTQTTTTQATPTTTAQATTAQATTTQAATTTAAPSAPASPQGNDYRGMRLQAAVQKIAQGRQQVVVAYVASSRPAGVVVANSTVGGKVRLQVSAGSTPRQATNVPDTTGEDQSTAQGDLTGAGFSVLTVQWPVSDQSSDGVVVAETPSTQAPQGATIVVYVGSSTSG
jgi:beta-lactam-binding protein with PASTA domain